MGKVMPPPKQQELDIFALLEQIEAQKQPAIEALTTTINDAIRKLIILGKHYQLVENGHLPAPNTPRRGRPPGSIPKPPKVAGPSALYNPKKHCDTCREDGHDGRLHRTHKASFSMDELAQRGVKPPEVS